MGLSRENEAEWNIEIGLGPTVHELDHLLFADFVRLDLLFALDCCPCELEHDLEHVFHVAMQ